VFTLLKFFLLRSHNFTGKNCGKFASFSVNVGASKRVRFWIEPIEQDSNGSEIVATAATSHGIAMVG
jgi:hypothetical protein